jgi:hypothetical protein
MTCVERLRPLPRPSGVVMASSLKDWCRCREMTAFAFHPQTATLGTTTVKTIQPMAALSQVGDHPNTPLEASELEGADVIPRSLRRRTMSGSRFGANARTYRSPASAHARSTMSGL